MRLFPVCAYVPCGARNYCLGSMTGPQNVPNDDIISFSAHTVHQACHTAKLL